MIIQALDITGDAVRMNHINDTPADTPIACQTFGGGRVPGANDTTGHYQPPQPRRSLKPGWAVGALAPLMHCGKLMYCGNE